MSAPKFYTANDLIERHGFTENEIKNAFKINSVDGTSHLDIKKVNQLLRAKEAVQSPASPAQLRLVSESPDSIPEFEKKELVKQVASELKLPQEVVKTIILNNYKQKAMISFQEGYQETLQEYTLTEVKKSGKQAAIAKLQEQKTLQEALELSKQLTEIKNDNSFFEYKNIISQVAPPPIQNQDLYQHYLSIESENKAKQEFLERVANGEQPTPEELERFF